MDENKMKEACDLLNYHKLLRRTPIMNAEKIINLPTYVELWFKLENMQNTGSFEIRGVINQVENIDKKGKFKKILTISQGNINYAKALSLISKQYERSRPLILLSGYFSRNAYKIIEKLGLGIEFVEKGMLQETIDSYLEENNMIFLHPYDDYNLIAGYASCGYEISEVFNMVDIVICCGGGGFLAGVASGVKSWNHTCKIYGVESYDDPIMFQSFKMRTPVTVDNVPDVTFTTKLEPPYSTKIAYDICSRNVEAIILVSDQEIRAAVAKCYRTGLIVEPSGCAALAALMVGKVPGIDNDVNIANFWDGKEVGDRNKNSFKPISNEYIQYSPFVDEIDNTGIIWRLSMGGRLNVVVVLAGGNIGTSVLTNIVNNER